MSTSRSCIGATVTGDHPLIVDLDATLVTAHSDKESTAPTYKRGYGFHPLCTFVDHGLAGTGEPVAILLRLGNAGANKATDHISVVKDALAQLPIHAGYRVGRKVLIRTDAGGATRRHRATSRGQTPKTTNPNPLRPARQPRERSRLVVAVGW